MNLVGGGVGDTIQSIEKDNIAASLSLAIPKSHIKSGLIHMMVSVCLSLCVVGLLDVHALCLFEASDCSDSPDHKVWKLCSGASISLHTTDPKAEALIQFLYQKRQFRAVGCIVRKKITDFSLGR